MTEPTDSPAAAELPAEHTPKNTTAFTAANESVRADPSEFVVEYCGTVDYEQMWHYQQELAGKRHRKEITDTVLILEHHSIYTAGKRTEVADRPTNGLPVIDVDRGGRITWHGPGQLVGYPIIQLAPPFDVLDYVRRVEEALIGTCHELGLTTAGRVEKRSGVWLPATYDAAGELLKPERKVAALGLRITRGVTMHGFALNCTNTLDYYEAIIPCGITDAGVTTLSRELGREVSVEEVTPIVLRHLKAAVDGEERVADHHVARTGNQEWVG